MHTFSVRAAARRTALAATLAALATTPIVAPTPTAAMPAPSTLHLEAAELPDTPRAHPRRVAHQAELRAQREAELRAQRRAEREAEQAAQTRGDGILAIASREAGTPTCTAQPAPDAFDCSGFTQ